MYNYVEVFMTKTEWNEAIKELNREGLYLFDRTGNQKTGSESDCSVYYAGYDCQDAMNVKKGYGDTISFSCENKTCYLEAIHDHLNIEYD